MSERLREMVNQGVIIEGSVRAFAEKADVSKRTLDAIVHEGHVPKPAIVRKIALARGLSEEAALELAQESAPQEAGYRAS